jgi:hypothetical protein
VNAEAGLDAGLRASVEAQAQKQNNHQTVSVQQVFKTVTADGEAEGAHSNRHSLCGVKRKLQRTSSCPPGRVHSVSAGPWSLEWARRHSDVVIGKAMQPAPSRNKKQTSGGSKVLRRKGSGYLRHCASNLKRIPRLSVDDRKEVLRALRKTHRRHKAVQAASKDKVNLSDNSSVNGSQSSVNNDWTNWLVLHGSSKVLPEDVTDLGKVVGLNFKGDNNNRFDVLSGVGRKKKEGEGEGK